MKIHRLIVRPLSYIVTLVACCFVLAISGCGEDPAPVPSPVDSFCTVGDKTCQGNYVATCSDGGKAYKLAFCGESKHCSTASGTAQCKTSVCEKAALSCDGDKVVECPANGASAGTPVQTCGAGQKCTSGTCVPQKCTDGDVRCGWRAVLTCKGEAWVDPPTACPGKQICSAGKCVERACTPDTASCKTATQAQVCNPTGSGYKAVDCKAGDKCYDGICHREVNGGTPGGEVADAGASDATVAYDGGSSGGAADVPGFLDLGITNDSALEKPDTLSVIISETAEPPAGSIPQTFSIASAVFLDVGKMLQISGDEGLYKLEIQLAKVEEFQTGNFSAGGGEAEDSIINMNDGTTDPNVIQWKFQSTDYSITVTDFSAKRIVGTFSAEMGDRTQKGKTIYLVDGKFDIARSQ